jgi:ATP-dependent helicase HrpA
LREQLRPKLRSALAKVAVHVEERGLTSWTLGDLPRHVEHNRGSQTVHGYPALVDEGKTVGVRVFEDEAQQTHAMRFGTRRLLLLTVPSPVVAIVKRLDNRTKLTLAASPYPDVLTTLEDCTASAVDFLAAGMGGRRGTRRRSSGWSMPYARTCMRSPTRTSPRSRRFSASSARCVPVWPS